MTPNDRTLGLKIPSTQRGVWLERTPEFRGDLGHMNGRGLPVMKRNMQWRMLALVAGLVLSAEASAQDVEKRVSGGDFGATGQLVISDDLQGSIGYQGGNGGVFFINI